MFKIRRFLAYLLLGYIIGLCHLLFFVDGRAVLCFLNDFLFLGTGREIIFVTVDRRCARILFWLTLSRWALGFILR